MDTSCIRRLSDEENLIVSLRAVESKVALAWAICLAFLVAGAKSNELAKVNPCSQTGIPDWLDRSAKYDMFLSRPKHLPASKGSLLDVVSGASRRVLHPVINTATTAVPVARLAA